MLLPKAAFVSPPITCRAAFPIVPHGPGIIPTTSPALPSALPTPDWFLPPINPPTTPLAADTRPPTPGFPRKLLTPFESPAPEVIPSHRPCILAPKFGALGANGIDNFPNEGIPVLPNTDEGACRLPM